LNGFWRGIRKSNKIINTSKTGVFIVEVNKQKILDWAEIVDAFRVVPRLLLLVTGGLVWTVISWYMGLDDPSTQQAALVTTATGIVPLIIGLYQNSGRKWKE
jgi:hypothetical protein